MTDRNTLPLCKLTVVAARSPALALLAFVIDIRRSQLRCVFFVVIAVVIVVLMSASLPIESTSTYQLSVRKINRVRNRATSQTPLSAFQVMSFLTLRLR